MEKKFLDKSGLQRFWDKAKSYIDSKASGVTSFNGRGGAVTPQSGDYSASQITFDPKTVGLTKTNTQGAIEELFTSVSNGKALIASAITDKGIKTEKDATFEQMRDNILSLMVVQPVWWSPVMTSDTTPAPFSCSASSSETSSTASSKAPYMAFDNSTPNSSKDAWTSKANDSDAWIMFDFGTNVQIFGVRAKTRTYTGCAAQFPKTIYVDVSSDGSKWETILMKTDIPKQTALGVFALSDTFSAFARYIRLSHLSDGGFYMNNIVGFSEVQFLVPPLWVTSGKIIENYS